MAQFEVHQHNKYQAMSPASLLPLIPSQVWVEILMDFLGALSKSKGFDTILVMVGKLTKYVHFFNQINSDGSWNC